MKIKALAPWYGCKRQLAPRIVRELGHDHACYCEPFAGSCSVLFAKDRCVTENVNDLHGDLINLALVVQAEVTVLNLYEKVARTLFHEDLLPRAKEELGSRVLLPENPDWERAYWYLVFSWMGINGVAGTPLSRTGTFAARFSHSGGNGGTRWRSVVESIPDWHQRLLGVQILRRDAFELLERIKDERVTAIYLDPPYLAKGSKYVHDLAPDDHNRLAELAGRFKRARVVVSYYDDPLLNDLYPGWTKVLCDMPKSMVNSGRRKKGKPAVAPEVLLVNGPSYSIETPLFGKME